MEFRYCLVLQSEQRYINISLDRKVCNASLVCWLARWRAFILQPSFIHIWCTTSLKTLTVMDWNCELSAPPTGLRSCLSTVVDLTAVLHNTRGTGMSIVMAMKLLGTNRQSESVVGSETRQAACEPEGGLGRACCVGMTLQSRRQFLQQPADFHDNSVAVPRGRRYCLISTLTTMTIFCLGSSMTAESLAPADGYAQQEYPPRVPFCSHPAYILSFQTNFRDSPIPSTVDMSIPCLLGHI